MISQSNTRFFSREKLKVKIDLVSTLFVSLYFLALFLTIVEIFNFCRRKGTVVDTYIINNTKIVVGCSGISFTYKNIIRNYIGSYVRTIS